MALRSCGMQPTCARRSHGFCVGVDGEGAGHREMKCEIG